ncbi:MAG: phosphoribosylformylglycinamidine synthase subunit PurL [Nitrospirae bacterium]|nr:phosphoribosylformylglycinamidine synthase subunit PurL [Nitrospirota bacterium]MBF0534085.1 phosphoribosylformylglycinamidine synthase subunit PurL [Nitrospirota bacterium]MBF0616244.1 phosphoribosylformylglycinamidine synthase subunit PurL [Nitrospirota bacterium]
MTEPQITDRLIKEHGLKPDEYETILKILGRTPTFTELGVFSVMWSEHCSYKSSRIHLKNFPTEAPWVIQGPGENAGVIDIGDNQAAVFKMESHNHPSFIEPYQGAATGVGGILRDIFTMGARPIASLNSLRFGPLSDPYQKHLFSGVVSGIAGYGNCIGVPTVGGEIYVHPCYAGNILVNAFNLGIADIDRIFYGKATGIGNLIVYVGSKTGKDGIHGVTMASEEFTDDAQQKKPNVQVGDPFTEKLLLEACLEAMRENLIVGIQDMGGAGLTSSSSEMAARANMGIELELSQVPLREANMIPYEIMLSESQERMLIVAEEKNLKPLLSIFKKWDLEAAAIGHVSGDGYLRIKWFGETVAEIPASRISTEAPMYDRPQARPDYQDELNTLDESEIEAIADNNDVLLKLLSSPNIASKELVWQEYDHMVRTSTVVLPGKGDAAVIRVHGSKKGIAMSVDCNSRYCYLDPYMGGIHTLTESARNVAATGAKPLAVTDCLNFGNPEKPEVMWQFAEALRGISDACRALQIPVISGNVSFYNETKGTAIYPTPTVGVVGIIDDVSQALTMGFKNIGDVVILLGPPTGSLGGSEYLSLLHGIEKGLPHPVDLIMEKHLIELIVKLCKDGLVVSSHDLSEGGLAVALAESSIVGNIGVEAELNAIAKGVRTDTLLYGESASRIVVSAKPEAVANIESMAKEASVPFNVIGKTVQDAVFKITLNGNTLTELPLTDISSAYKESLQRGLTNAHV